MKTTARAPQTQAQAPAPQIVAPALQDQHELGNQAVLQQALGPAQGDQGLGFGMGHGVDNAPLDIDGARAQFGANREEQSVEVELLDRRYTFLVVDREDQRDARHVTMDELGRVRRVFTALGREVRALEGGDVHPSLRKGLRLGDFATTPEGAQAEGLVVGQAALQARKAVDRMALECTRSAAYRTILETLTEGEGAPVELLFGKHSCGFFDSYASSAVDIDDYDCLQDVDRPFQGNATHPDDGTGISKGELLMHVLEERMHMVRSAGHDYERAHYAAMAEGSFQNQYRAERGLAGRTVDLDCTAGKDHHHEHFVTMDDQGNRTTVHDVPTKKSSVPGLGWTPGQADVEHDRVDTAQVATDKVEQVVHMLAAEPRLDDRKLAALRHWAGVGQANPGAAVAAAEARLDALRTRFREEVEALRSLAALDRERARNERTLAELREEVDGVDADTLSTEVPALDLPATITPEQWAAYQRDGSTGGNFLLQRNLEKHKKATEAQQSPRAAHEAAMARIVELEATQAAHGERVQAQVDVLRRHGAPLLLPAQPTPWSQSAAYETARGQNAEGIARYRTALARQVTEQAPVSAGSAFLAQRRADRPAGINDAERIVGGEADKAGRNCSFASLGALLGCTASEASMRAQAKAGVAQADPALQTEEAWWRMEHNGEVLTDDKSALGDAQWAGLQGLMRDEGADLRTLTVQGQPDRGHTQPQDQLIEALRALGDGAQAVVWLTDAAFHGGHYVYAEVYDGRVVFEDHQHARQTERDGVRGGTATVEELPRGGPLGVAQIRSRVTAWWASSSPT